jgi:hypothetical protein
MFIVLLRSVCCGIAALVVAMFSGIFIALCVGSYFVAKNVNSGGGEVGWDLVSMAHNMSSGWLLLPVLVFAVGFLIGFRHFSKSLGTK